MDGVVGEEYAADEDDASVADAEADSSSADDGCDMMCYAAMAEVDAESVYGWVDVSDSSDSAGESSGDARVVMYDVDEGDAVSFSAASDDSAGDVGEGLCYCCLAYDGCSGRDSPYAVFPIKKDVRVQRGLGCSAKALHAPC